MFEFLSPRDAKTGGRAVPLAPSAIRLLESLPRNADNPWVIASRKRGVALPALARTRLPPSLILRTLSYPEFGLLRAVAQESIQP